MQAGRLIQKLLLVSLLGAAQSALAFGPADVFGMVFDVGRKVGGALVDKAIDATKDPEVERQKKQKAQDEQERAQIEGFKKAEAEIESHREWTPLQREKTRLKLIATYAQVKAMGNFVQSMQDQQEAARRAENDRILSVGGLASTVAGAALNTSTVQMAQADALVKTGIPQAQTRQAMAMIDNKGQPTTAGQLQGVANAVAGAQALDTANAALQAQALPPEMVDAASAAKASATESANALSSQSASKPAEQDFFSPDLGRKIYVEFVDSERLTHHFRDTLAQRGHQLADSQAAAEVVYRIEGEFEIPENGMHQGVSASAGKLLEHKASVQVPEVKVKGSVATFFVKSLMAIVPSKDPSGVKPEVKLMMAQSALLVASRNAAQAQELRLSVLKKDNSNELKTDAVLASAMDELFAKLGVPAPAVPEVANVPAAAVEPVAQ